MQLSLHNEEVASVFDLLGGDENATFSMGWTLSQSPIFCRCLLKSILGEVDTGKDFKLFLQDHADDGGFTDIEIENEKVHVIIEAKLGLNLPSERQLCRYRPGITSLP